MESNSTFPAGPPDPGAGPSAADAQAALDALAQSRGALADRLVTPRWYHPTLALLVAAFVGSEASATWALIVFPLYCGGLVWLITAYAKVTGLRSNGWRMAGARRYAVLLFVVLLTCLGVSLAVRSGRLDWWWAAVAAVSAGLSTWWAGPRFDAASRAALRAG